MAYIAGPNLIINPPIVPFNYGGPWQNSATEKLYVILSGAASTIWEGATVEGPSPWTSKQALPGTTPLLAYYDSATSVIYIYIRNPVGSVWSLLSYDTTSGVLTTIDNTGGGPTVFSYAELAKCSDGSLAIVYGVGGQTMKIIRYAAGWGVPASVGSVSEQPLQVIADGSGNLYALAFPATGDALRVIKIKADNSVDYALNVTSGIAGSIPIRYSVYSLIVLNAGELAVASWDGKVWTATNESGGVFSQALGGIGGGSGFFPPSVCVYNGSIYAIWDYQEIDWVGPVGTTIADEMRLAEYLGGGSWGTIQVGVSFVDHPPIFPPGIVDPLPSGQNNYSHLVWNTRPVSNGFGTVTDFIVNSGELTCTLFYVNYSPEPPPTPEDQPIPRECFYLRVQNPADSNEVTVDWTRWLGTGDAISSVIWTATVGVTVGTALHNSTKASASFTIPAAVTGETYYLTCQVTSQLGLVDLRTIQVDIREGTGGTRTAIGWWRS